MSTLHPDQVLESLLAKGCRKDKEENLRQLHDICLAEFNRHSQGARDLSIAHIGRIAEAHKLFKQRTLWNAQSVDYVALIKAWAAFSGPRKPLVSKRLTAPDDKYAILERIDDPAVRSFCHIALAERDKLRSELNMLKATNVWSVDMRPKSVAISGDLAPSGLSLTESETRSLSLAIDPKTLSAKNWRETESGGIVDERGKPIFEPGFARGIRKTLKAATPLAIEAKGTRKLAE